MQKKDFIFFTHTVPLPPTGGGTRSYHILKSLADAGNVSLVVFNPLDEKAKDLLSKICSKVFYVEAATDTGNNNLPRKLSTPFKWLMPFLMSNYELNGRLSQLNKGRHVTFLNMLIFKWLSYWFKFRNYYPAEVYMVKNNIKRLEKDINQLLKIPGKILVFDFNYFLPALSERFNLREHAIISNSHNVEFDILKQSLRFKTNFINAAWNKIQYRAMEKAERISLALSDKVLCCSVKDKEIYQSMVKNVGISVVPNGVDTTYFFPSSPPESGRSILFTGTMNYAPNIQAVHWFLKEVFPGLLKRYADLIFIIAGKEADKLLLNHNNIRIFSSPDDIRPCFREACVYIVPLKQGGGTRLKIMEAAAMGKPVVSTSVGAEGLEGLTVNNIILADTESAFGNAISVLLENEGLRTNMSENLYRWVKNYYSWSEISKQISENILN